jgi:sulfur relay (sulfurtransferase) DsrF/TusC family protein
MDGWIRKSMDWYLASCFSADRVLLIGGDRMIKKLAFIVRSLPYKNEATRLALTHAIASQTVEIYLEDGDNVEPFLALVGDGVLCGLKNQSNKCYGITTMEQHITNALLLDLNVYYCKEDLERFAYPKISS